MQLNWTEMKWKSKVHSERSREADSEHVKWKEAAYDQVNDPTGLHV